MESSRRAVESYWRSRMIDAATSDEDKVTPVYKLEEISELLRSSHSSIVKEVSEFIFKRLQHKSPIVKQKALRVIKYAVGKSGVEFRREIQRNSVAVRQLIHYKGHPDPLKGDALNKAVRETAQEALSAIFSTDDNKPAPTENLGGRIQGFGNTNFTPPVEDKKSFLSEVVDIGSATIMQGISNLTQTPSIKKNEAGSYRSPNLQRSLTIENSYSDRYESGNSHSDNRGTNLSSKSAVSGNWGQDLRTFPTEMTTGDSGMNYGEKTREEKLIETIVTSGGVRLQPTRDALQVFLVEAVKLDALALSRALQSKLQSPSWQVRVKAVCVLEAILRKKEEEQFSVVASYFSDNIDLLVKCCESPQATLREKASKVLNLLDGDGCRNAANNLDNSVKAEKTTIEMPDLIDTGDFGTEDSTETHGLPRDATTTSTIPLVDNLLGDGLDIHLNNSDKRSDDDPFADVSFHRDNVKEQESDPFSGMTFDKSGATAGAQNLVNNGSDPFDFLGSNSDVSQEHTSGKSDVHHLMGGLSIDGNDSLLKQNGTHLGGQSGKLLPDSTSNSGQGVANDILNGLPFTQAAVGNATPILPIGTMPYNLPAGFMLNPLVASQPLNYSAVGTLFTQQQLLATMSGLQQLGSFQQNASFNQQFSSPNAGYCSAIPDIFNANLATQTPAPITSSSKKEDTKAFDFISDHLAAARDTKKMF